MSNFDADELKRKTPKGEALLQGKGKEEIPASAKAAAEAAQSAAREKVEANLPKIPAEFASWLAKNFDHPLWKTISLRCHGCGACASICPTCHCFDIVDEHDSSNEGVRRRNWDSCQTSKFTLHASGHNPRGSQNERFRQRIQHKFSIYPAKFGDILCTGCGRCARACPGGMDLPTILGELMAMAKAEPEGKQSMNIYQPYLMNIKEITDETVDTRTFRLEFKDPEVAEKFTFNAGQFGEYSVFGEGESTFCIASPSTRKGYIECSFKASGKVTRALRRLSVGDTLGFRGPYGNNFPLDNVMKGHNMLFIAGGIGLAPVRSVIWTCLDQRDQFKDVTIVYGARSVGDLVYKRELEEWGKRSATSIFACRSIRAAKPRIGRARSRVFLPRSKSPE